LETRRYIIGINIYSYILKYSWVLLQVVSLIRRVLLDVQPKVLAGLMGVSSLPRADFGILSDSGSTTDHSQDGSTGPEKIGILDLFLACIAKALTVQVRRVNCNIEG